MGGFETEESDPVPANLKHVRLHYAAFAAQDIDGIIAGLDPSVVIEVHDEHGKGTGDQVQGLEGARRFFEEIANAVTNPTVVVDSLRGDDNRVLARITLGGTARHTGRTGTIPAVHLFTLHDGLITEIRTHRPEWRHYGEPE